jgi:hypothetical protein
MTGSSSDALMGDEMALLKRQAKITVEALNDWVDICEAHPGEEHDPNL